MTLFFNVQDAIKDILHHFYVNRHNITWCNIASYGLWCGIPENKYGKINDYIFSFKLFDVLNNYDNIHASVVICVPQYQANRFNRTVEYFNNIHFTIVPKMFHAKYIQFSDGYTMLGSANITDSDFAECIRCDYLSHEEHLKLCQFHASIKKELLK